MGILFAELWNEFGEKILGDGGSGWDGELGR